MVCYHAVTMFLPCSYHVNLLYLVMLFPKLHALDDGMKVMASAGGWAPGI